MVKLEVKKVKRLIIWDGGSTSELSSTQHTQLNERYIVHGRRRYHLPACATGAHLGRAMHTPAASGYTEAASFDYRRPEGASAVVHYEHHLTARTGLLRILANSYTRDCTPSNR